MNKGTDNNPVIKEKINNDKKQIIGDYMNTDEAIKVTMENVSNDINMEK